MIKLNLGEIEFGTKADIVHTLNEIANKIDYGYISGITCGGVCWDIEGDEEPEEDEEKEFTCSAPTIDRDLFESMPCPMDTSSLTDEDMLKLADAIGQEMQKWKEWLEDGSINQDEYEEHLWKVAEECGLNFGMTYYED